MGRVGNFKRRMNFFSKKFLSACIGFFLAIAPIFLALLGVHKFFSFNFPLREYVFALPFPPISFVIVPMFIVSSRNAPSQGVADFDTTEADDRSRLQQHF